ncbi:MAG: hypothetical protein IT271_12335 [Chitinophagales bacterium]|nr:hypothetical protein [Chitinophagales bacterium]
MEYGVYMKVYVVLLFLILPCTSFCQAVTSDSTKDSFAFGYSIGEYCVLLNSSDLSNSLHKLGFPELNTLILTQPVISTEITSCDFLLKASFTTSLIKEEDIRYSNTYERFTLRSTSSIYVTSMFCTSIGYELSFLTEKIRVIPTLSLSQSSISLNCGLVDGNRGGYTENNSLVGNFLSSSVGVDVKTFVWTTKNKRTLLIEKLFFGIEVNYTLFALFNYWYGSTGTVNNNSYNFNEYNPMNRSIFIGLRIGSMF